MRNTRGLIFGFAIATFAFAAAAYAQDSPSLGDLARQQRQQKGPSMPGPDSKKVYTNADLPRHSDPGPALEVSDTRKASDPAPSNITPQSSERLRSQIRLQKDEIASLQKQVDEEQESIHYAPGNCIRNCVQWNEKQERKQGQVERMQAQLEEQKKQLEQMQESARRQGYGSAVYDP
jgi:hypothetical protein